MPKHITIHLFSSFHVLNAWKHDNYPRMIAEGWRVNLTQNLLTKPSMEYRLMVMNNSSDLDKLRGFTINEILHEEPLTSVLADALDLAEMISGRQTHG